MATTGCFIEGNAGAYALDYDESKNKYATGFGFAFGFYFDMGVARVATGIGGDIVIADGYEDSDGTGYTAHAAGPYYARGDLTLKTLHELFSLDLTAGAFFGQGPAVVIFDEVGECAAGCNRDVTAGEGAAKVKHAGPSVGGYLGPSIALHNQGPGELRLTFAGSIIHTNVKSRAPFTAYGAQVRLVYGFTTFGGKSARFSGLFDNYSNTLDDDLREHDKKQGERNERRKEEEKRQKDENQRRKRGY